MKSEAGGGSVGSKANTPPTVAARVTPAPVDGTVFGLIPLDVAVNLCQSSDPDPADSIRFDVVWGDGAVTGPGAPGAGTTVGEGGGPTGCDGRDCCRHRHRFENEGTYQVEARVSDKHLEDQSGGVSAKAITPYRFVVRAGTPEPASFGFGSFSGSLDTSDPQFNRPTGSFVPPSSGLPCSISGIIPNYYDTYLVRHTGGPMQIETILGTLDDSFLNVYAGSFNPSNGCQNRFAADDDNVGLESLIQANFPAGDYVIVVTSFDPIGSGTGTYTLIIQ
ncbi:MAG: hypothetical protein AB7O37_09955 [Vicinamibacteria bacterium]